ncbi:MAG: FAD-dependent oxidoreductase, partial [Gammaproteobacteria bacterium]|nr:FAD-dependent oxidoreductase [Gammaproteobacteria bacterium]
DIRTYSRVTSINVDQGAVRSVDYVDTLTGTAHQVDVLSVVNAAGPWVDAVLSVAPGKSPQLIGGTKGSHIIVSAFDGAPHDAFYVEAATDGRPFFIIPWNGLYLIGTTDIRFEGDIAALRASREEVDYLLRETNRVFPNARLTSDAIHYAYSGVRPLPYREKGPESAITRRHIIKENSEIARGMISIIGGKLTTYRHLAEQTVKQLGKLLGRKLPACRTQNALLAGAYRLAEARAALESFAELSQAGVARLLRIYGGRAIQVLELAKTEPRLSKTIDANKSVMTAEVVFALREELARTLTDIVYRRLMLGFGADQGRELYQDIADIAAAELGWSDEQRAAELNALSAYSDSFVGEY